MPRLRSHSCNRGIFFFLFPKAITKTRVIAKTRANVQKLIKKAAKKQCFVKNTILPIAIKNIILIFAMVFHGISF